MIGSEHHYRVLEIERTASDAEIREAWRDLVQVWHPDRFPSNPRLQAKAAAKLRAINAAYEQLRSRTKKPLAAKPAASSTNGSAPSEPPQDTSDPESLRAPLDVLGEGVQSWNVWRNKYSSKPIELNLADLRGWSLSIANFSEAQLRGACLQKADLYRANFTAAQCRGATFHAADLSRSTFVRADLTGADLSDAELSSAVLRGANLNRTKLHNANLGACDLRGADLRAALGIKRDQIRAAIVDTTTRLPKLD